MFDLDREMYNTRDILNAGVCAIDNGCTDPDFIRGVNAVVAQILIPEVENDELANWLIDSALITAAAQ